MSAEEKSCRESSEKGQGIHASSSPCWVAHKSIFVECFDFDSLSAILQNHKQKVKIIHEKQSLPCCWLNCSYRTSAASLNLSPSLKRDLARHMVQRHVQVQETEEENILLMEDWFLSVIERAIKYRSKDKKSIDEASELYENLLQRLTPGRRPAQKDPIPINRPLLAAAQPSPMTFSVDKDENEDISKDPIAQGIEKLAYFKRKYRLGEITQRLKNTENKLNKFGLLRDKGKNIAQQREDVFRANNNLDIYTGWSMLDYGTDQDAFVAR